MRSGPHALGNVRRSDILEHTVICDDVHKRLWRVAAERSVISPQDFSGLRRNAAELTFAQNF